MDDSVGPVVETCTGPVRGVTVDGIDVFRGIPYASNPIGLLRLGAPEPIARWAAVRQAVDFGAAPPQPAGPAAAPTAGPEVDPDGWLTLNVWRPSADAARPRAVLVWIYGGAYLYGGTTNPTFDGARLARDGDLVVATVNYRVGAEGFARVPGRPNNRGLLDLLTALKWIHDSCPAFGADAGRITVAGQSAGAGCVAALCSIGESKGLFQQAILQSVPRLFLTPELADRVTGHLADELSPTTRPEDLSDVAPAALADATGQLTASAKDPSEWGEMALMPTPFAPVLDATLLTEDPWTAARSGATREIAMIVGHTRDEYRLFLALQDRLDDVPADEVRRALATLTTPAQAEVYRTWFSGRSDSTLYEVLMSDWLFRMPSLAMAEAHVSAGGTCHLYELTATVPGQHGRLGAPHGADVPLVFGNYPPTELTYGGQPGPQLSRLGDRMRAVWTGFIRGENPKWSPYDNATQATQIFDEESYETRYRHQRSRAIWRDDPVGPLTIPGAASAPSGPGR